MDPQQFQNPSLNTTPPSDIPVQSPEIKEHKKIGPIITALVVVIVILGVILYFVARQISTNNSLDQSAPAALQSPTNQSATLGEQTLLEQQTVKPVSNKSDDLDSLQSDLNSAINGIDEQSI